MRLLLLVGAAMICGLLMASAGCVGTNFGTCADDGTCSLGDGGTDAGDDSPIVVVVRRPNDTDAGDGGAPDDGANGANRGDSSCPSDTDPTETPCLVNDSDGVFVSADALDGGTGTRLSPLGTIGQGIAQASANGQSRVYICSGRYSEQVVLGQTSDGISLYGGFDCSHEWAWTGIHADVVPSTSLYALRITGTTKPIVIEDMTFMVQDANGQDDSGSGQSSVAAFVGSATAEVTLRRVMLSAGDGARGGPTGAPPTNWYSANPADLRGNAGPSAAHALASLKVCSCPLSGQSTGGSGNGTAMPAAVPDSAHGLDGLAGMNGDNGQQSPQFACTNGDPGANGSPGDGVGTGQASVGAIVATGWQPTLGVNGPPGNPGQGGGGGGSWEGNSGGGGGCGGCGGAGGLGGGGGGGSIALLLFDSKVSVAAANLVTQSGGGGGMGAPGETGSIGGAGGLGYSDQFGSDGCNGGAGGGGAGGGGGGAGASGVSVGILSNTSSAVVVDSTTTYAIGPAGAQSSGGAPGGGAAGSYPAPSGVAGPKGNNGVSQQSLSL